MKEQWKTIIAISIGAAIGTLSRYYLAIITVETGYPYGTMLANLLGSFLLGLLTAWLFVSISKEWVKTGLGVGLCGGFTTMSTFAADTVLLASAYSFLDAAWYVLISIFGGILMAHLGFLAGTFLTEKNKARRKNEVNRG